MANVQTYRPPQGPLSQGPATFAELIGGVAVLAGIGVLIYAVFHVPLLLSLMGKLLLGVLADPFAPLGGCLVSLGFGALAGALIAWIRLRNQGRVIDELAGAAVSPETVSAAQVSWAAAGLSVSIGLGSGLMVARLGLLDWRDSSSGVVEPFMIAAGLWGGGGGPDAGGGDLLITLLAILLVILVVTLVWALGITTVSASVAKSLATGASHGIGRALGMAMVLALTRLRTTIVKEGAQHGPAGRLTFEAACERFVDSGRAGSGAEERREVVGLYLNWLRTRGIIPAANSIREPVRAYCAQSARLRDYEGHQARTVNIAKTPAESGWDTQKPLRVARAIAREAAHREEAILQAFADEVPWSIRDREPEWRMATTDGAPVFDGSRETLLHGGWRIRSLLTGAREGALVGIVSGLLALGVSVVLR